MGRLRAAVEGSPEVEILDDSDAAIVRLKLVVKLPLSIVRKAVESNAPAEFVIESQVEAVLENVIQDVAKNHIVTEKSTSLPPPGLGPAYCADDSSASTGHDIWSLSGGAEPEDPFDRVPVRACKAEPHYHDYTERFKWDWNSARYMLRDAEQRNHQRQEHLKEAYVKLHCQHAASGGTTSRRAEDDEAGYDLNTRGVRTGPACSTNLPSASDSFRQAFGDVCDVTRQVSFATLVERQPITAQAHHNPHRMMECFGDEASDRTMNVVTGGGGEEEEGCQQQ